MTVTKNESKPILSRRIHCHASIHHGNVALMHHALVRGLVPVIHCLECR